MIKTLKNILHQDRDNFRVPRRVQDTIPIKRIWKDGIFLVGNKYSKTFKFTDINYSVASEADQLDMFLQYSDLLNSLAYQTNVATDNPYICYDIHDLGPHLRSVGMLVVLDSIYNRILRNRKQGRFTFVFIDEIYLLFGSEYSSNFLLEQWKRARKCGACYTGISQNVEELLKSDNARTMLANSEFITLLNQAATDRQELSDLLGISDTQLSYVSNAEAGKGLLLCSGNIVPFEDKFPKDSELYKLMTTKPREMLTA